MTDLSLAEALELSGFRVVESFARFLPYTMVGKKPLPPFFLKLYLKMPFAWRFFGKQFLVIAEKPS
ncbi:MAG: hypothetical protein AAGJ79_14175 [Verrucomicrobiota bacterium]